MARWAIDIWEVHRGGQDPNLRLYALLPGPCLWRPLHSDRSLFISPGKPAYGQEPRLDRIWPRGQHRPMHAYVVNASPKRSSDVKKTPQDRLGPRLGLA